MADIKELKAALQKDLDRLVELRDELRVQLRLAKDEARSEWDRLEINWQAIQDEIKRIGEHTKEPVKELGVASQKLLEELKQGYERIRAQLKGG
jgi:predicted  nucleic acid-binding Zn-ribbon protein